MIAALVLVSVVVGVFGQNDPNCGSKGPATGPNYSSYVVGGTDTAPLEFPWQLSLQRRASSAGAFSHTCGASLINNEWVLTAAHCVDSDSNVANYRVDVGKHDTQVQSPQEIRLSVKRIIIHPNWDSANINNDQALIQLERAVNLNGNESHIGTVCVPDKVPIDSLANTLCIATGFGRLYWNGPLPRYLQKVTVKVHSQADCVAKHGSFIRTGMICFGESTSAVCSGDSGGPLNCLVDGKWYTYGAHSFTIDRCTGPNNVSVASRNSEYSAWVWAQIAYYKNK